MTSRRTFIRTTAIGTSGLIAAAHFPFIANAAVFQTVDLYKISEPLVKQWATALINLQVTDKSRTDDYGGIWCPADQAVHGRVGDAISPFFYMADKTKDSKYIDASVLLYRWMENRVSQPDGSWLNEPVKGSWKGTTVFAAIALAEALKNYGALMDSQFKGNLTDRLKKAGDYIYDNFTLDYGNINYPVTASYGLSLLGTVLDVAKFKTKGRDLAHQALQYISKDGFLYGEGDLHSVSKKGCVPVDLGYNVEESLPSLVLYGRLTKDDEVLDAVTHSLQSHLQFMLPDGGWDNSWGTRNYKWTYYGSRTSDGCQTAYALMADRDARFYKAALKNTQLMQQCTHDGLLQGGLHNAAHLVTPCVQHTFSHIKALTNVLEYGNHQAIPNIDRLTLPREEVYGSRFFADIQTWLISKGAYRATVTGYEMEYKKTRGGHATGGALSMLWHQKTGPIFVGSMNEYQLYEAGNQQPDNDPLSIPLTPRIELKLDGISYSNINDLTASVNVIDMNGNLAVNAHAKLVNKDQQNPASGEINCQVSYVFNNEKVIMKFSYDQSEHDNEIKTILPVISKANEPMVKASANEIHIAKPQGRLKISANQPISQLPTSNGRVFNFVPGLEAIPFCIHQNDVVVEIEVI